jgi:transcriptional regulator with XRE-family HTH domain
MEVKIARLAKHASLKEVAILFDVSEPTVNRIWKRARDSFKDPEIKSFSASPLKKSGRPVKWSRDDMRESIKEVPLQHKKTIRKLAKALGVPKTTVHRIKQDTLANAIVPHINSVKPLRTDLNKLSRLSQAESHLNLETGLYNHVDEWVHVNEKWSFITEAQSHLLYLASDEVTPVRRVKHKSHIEKVMFLSAVARPRFNAQGDMTWDGLIGIWPFTRQVAAQHGSVNRPAGTIETKNVNVTKDVYREFMITKVIPAIKAKWPNSHNPSTHIKIQQDGAKTHHKPNDAIWMAAATTHNWHFELVPQSANSPDTNICDLSFFRALQLDQWNKGFATTTEQLVAQVENAFRHFDPLMLNRSFLTLQTCYDEILKSNGNNAYSIPHINKARLEREGTLPRQLPASANALDALAAMAPQEAQSPHESSNEDSE